MLASHHRSIFASLFSLPLQFGACPLALGDRGDRMSGLLNMCVRLRLLLLQSGCGAMIFLALASLPLAAFADAQQRREREPNSVYAQRRARLAATADAPIII